MREKILLVDDDKSVVSIIKEILETEYAVSVAMSGEAALEAAAKDIFNLVITDMQLPGMNGMEVVRRLKEMKPDISVIILTGYGTIENAIEMIKAGVYNYLTKPVQVDNLLINVKRALEHSRLKNENISLKEEVKKKYAYENLILGKSEVLRDICRTICMIADTDTTILICGESGTGKELVAKAIHYQSLRREFPFVPVNCGAIPGELIESELFGHEKGAFTGAVAARLGRFERANRGTIFLDEIGDMPFHLQVKLLRILQEKEIERVGGTKSIPVDVRVIAATNKDMEDAVEKGLFRKDLYYRLNVMPIFLPPLRERREDIPFLIQHFLEHMNRKKKRHVKGVSKKAIDIFMNYHWPGNVRELENIVERIVILKQDNGEIMPEDLPMEVKKGKKLSGAGVAMDIPQEGINLTKIMDEMESRFIEKAINKAGGVKSKAAELLGVNRTTLIEKMKKKGMLTTIGKV